MIQCNRCNLQYIREAKRSLKDRFNEHRRTIDNPNTKSKPTTAAEHFLTAHRLYFCLLQKYFPLFNAVLSAKCSELAFSKRQKLL